MLVKFLYYKSYFKIEDFLHDLHEYNTEFKIKSSSKPLLNGILVLLCIYICYFIHFHNPLFYSPCLVTGFILFYSLQFVSAKLLLFTTTKKVKSWQQ